MVFCFQIFCIHSSNNSETVHFRVWKVYLQDMWATRLLLEPFTHHQNRAGILFFLSAVKYCIALEFSWHMICWKLPMLFYLFAFLNWCKYSCVYSSLWLHASFQFFHLIMHLYGLFSAKVLFSFRFCILCLSLWGVRIVTLVCWKVDGSILNP